MITIEQLEELAETAEAEVGMERKRLHRLIRAYARIIEAREPAKFGRRPLERADEDGHWDGSYPPKIQLKNFAGPRALKIIGHKTSDIATSSGFYHSWRRETEDGGLYVGPRGELYACTEKGTGEVGQYAAHPGDHNVECELEYSELDLEDVALEALSRAEETLRGLAFPLLAAREAAAESAT